MMALALWHDFSSIGAIVIESFEIRLYCGARP
jgi:hypothetical protein